MKKFQKNRWAKLCAVLVLLCAAFGTGVFGVRAVLSFGSASDSNWQSSSRYYIGVDSRQRELLNGVYVTQHLEMLEKRVEDGTANAMTYADIEALQKRRTEIEERFFRNNTWFRFCLMDAATGEVMGTNLREGQSMLQSVKNIHYYTFDLAEDFWAAYGYYDPDRAVNEILSGEAAEQNAGEAQEPRSLVLEYGVPEVIDDSVQDEFYQMWKLWDMERAAFDQYLTGFLNLGVLTLLALIWVLWSAGHKSGTEGIVLTWQERIFFDVYTAVMIAAALALASGTVWAAERLYWGSANVYSIVNEDFNSFFKMGILGAGALFAAGVACVALILRTFVVRIKAHCLARSTLLCRVCGWTVLTVHEFIRFLPFTWKMVLGFGVYVFVSLWLIMLGRYDGVFMLVYFCLQLALAFFLAWWAYGYYRLRQGTKTIAGGNLEYQIDTRRMPYDLRLQAEDLNNISGGLAGAVDEKMKSERFKAELITNVSHDLKTPLTSIINYVNLLKSTSQTDPKAMEYIDVLDRKSQRLKKLTEDLVEASKASTGVLSVTREKIGMAQLIDQALAEWEERLSAQKLTLVTTLPEGETWVYADGRHLWRVIDNLLSNCAKYAMEGTRVYLDLERGKGQVALSVKNISREPLNVPAQRLMERFVRGEESRSTEGSGLGLSIARSLTELQGGSFDLAVDGDLFKAIVTLPQAS